MRGFKRRCGKGVYRDHIHSYFGQARGVRSVEPSSSMTILSSFAGEKPHTITVFVIRFTTALAGTTSGWQRPLAPALGTFYGGIRMYCSRCVLPALREFTNGGSY